VHVDTHDWRPAMSTPRPLRILVLTDTVDAGPGLLEAMSRRSSTEDVVFRLVVLNPARAEVHLLHPERHVKAAEAEQVLRRTLPRLESAIGGHPIVGSVSVRHDPMDAIEETMASEPIEEVMLHVLEHGLAKRLHQDLVHRLTHQGVTVQVVEHEPPT
jgi:hypothetical protein